MEPERIELLSARARPARDLLSVVAGLSGFGLIISLIGWINLYITPRSLTDAPLEWFFGVAGSLCMILALLFLLVHQVMFRRGLPVVLSEADVVFVEGTRLPWSAFEHVELVWRTPHGHPELIGLLAAALPEETRRSLTAYLVRDLGGDRPALRLGDLDSGQAAEVRASIRDWTGREITERSA
ncbi:MAG: hypothetical protein JWN00_2497 [Actinomycetia bacterium]|nr:hypothetical protein [Actinomycetes bacterium]